MSVAKEIEIDVLALDNIVTNLLETLQRVPAEITLSTLEQQGDIVLALRQLRDTLKEGLTKSNKILAPVEQHLCQTIANKIEDGLSYKHPKATITASARGFFVVVDGIKFYEWLCKDGNEKAPLQKFINYVNSKKERAELCDNLLSDGKDVPAGIKEHIIASVTIRRKSDE